MWTTNNYGIADFTFVQIGFVVAVVVPFILGLTFPIVKRKNREWGKRFVGILTWGYLAIMIADLIYAIVTHQFAAFLESFGWSTLFEFSALAAGFFLLMLFMANKALADPALPDGAPSTTEVPDSITISRESKGDDSQAAQ